VAAQLAAPPEDLSSMSKLSAVRVVLKESTDYFFPEVIILVLDFVLFMSLLNND
jgi:hypothetical protein